MQRYFSNKKIENTFILNEEDNHHFYTVMRGKENDNLEIVYNKELYKCILSNNQIVIEEKLESKLLNKKQINLIVPILKEKKIDLILQKGTELGVDNIYIVKMDRCNVNIEKKEEKKLLRWQTICKEASQQSKRIDMPSVYNIKLEDLKDTKGLKIVASTKEKQKNIKNVLKSNSNYDTLYIVVGPEGGLSPKEEDYLNEIGFISTTFGNNIMRVETVPLFILSALIYENME